MTPEQLDFSQTAFLLTACVIVLSFWIRRSAKITDFFMVLSGVVVDIVCQVLIDLGNIFRKSKPRKNKVPLRGIEKNDGDRLYDFSITEKTIDNGNKNNKSKRNLPNNKKVG